jgi:hypothetical protein
MASLAAWRRPFAAATPWLFAVLLAVVILQVGLAGAGLLSDPSYLAVHMEFVHVLEGVGLLAILCAFLGGDRLAGWSAVALYVLIGAQYALIRAAGLLRAAHVLNALLIFAVTLLVLRERLPWTPRARASA